ncbi:calcium channel flower homolog isoform X2 [Ptychodera flava]|uniref:calcium channel flower homolog isoform X2 n=1 Tax=Ptychodera flava TaxID=63121 RepID=UPI003969F343
MDSRGAGDFNQSSPGPDDKAVAVNINSTPNPQVQSDPEVSWWFRILVRAVGAVAGVLCMIFGLWRCITFTPLCLVAGILMMVLGFIVVVLEAPICCQWLDLVDRITKWVDLRPYWQKAASYFVLAIIPVALCASLSTFLGCGAVFITGVLYGLMAVGKKGGAARNNSQPQPHGQPEEQSQYSRIDNNDL